MFELKPYQPHPDHPTYPKWAATRKPTPVIVMAGRFKVVSFQYHPAEWFDDLEAAAERQRAFNAETCDVETADNACEAHNAPLRETADG